MRQYIEVKIKSYILRTSHGVEYVTLFKRIPI